MLSIGGEMKVLYWAVAVAALVGCDIEDGEPAADEQICIPGQQVACACPGEEAGVQICLDGEGFGACACDAVPPEVVLCADGPERFCRCGDAPGVQECVGEAYGVCDCETVADPDPDPESACRAVVCAEFSVPCPSISECDGALESDARVSIRSSSSERAVQALYLEDWLCDASASSSLFEWAHQRSFGGGGNIGFGGFSFGMNAQSSRSEQRREFETWQHTRCERDIQSFDEEMVASLLSSIEDSTAPLRAWASCVHDVMGAYASCRRSAGGFVGGASPAIQGLMLVPSAERVAEGQAFDLRLRWCGLPGSDQALEADVVSFSVSGADCAQVDRVAPGTALCPGDVTLRCERTSSDAVRASVDIAVQSPGAGRRSVSASAYMPPLCGQTSDPCCGGRCSFPGDQCVEGWCTEQCQPGERRCRDGDCEIESPDSCGATCEVCPTPAGGRATCDGGRCGFSCEGGLSACDGLCLNLRDDEANCGGCGRRCRGDQTCGGGQCACPAGTVECNGACRRDCDERCDGRDNNGDGRIDEGGVCARRLPQGVIRCMGHARNRARVTCDNAVVTVNGGCPAGWEHVTWDDRGAPGGVWRFGCERSQSADTNVLPSKLVTRLGHSMNGPRIAECPAGQTRVELGDFGAPGGEGFVICELTRAVAMNHDNRDDRLRWPCGLSHTRRPARRCDGRVINNRDGNCPGGYALVQYGDRGDNAGHGQYACVP